MTRLVTKLGVLISLVSGQMRRNAPPNAAHSATKVSAMRRMLRSASASSRNEIVTVTASDCAMSKVMDVPESELMGRLPVIPPCSAPPAALSASLSSWRRSVRNSVYFTLTVYPSVVL